MLSFFRRYEKTFLLLIFAPALLSLGILPTVASQLFEHDPVMGRLFGQEVKASEFDRVARLYQTSNPGQDEDSSWRFLALLRAAERAGIQVSDEELGKKLLGDSKWDIARYLAEKEVQEQKIDTSTPEGQRAFQGAFMKHLMESQAFDPKLYREVKGSGRGGLDVRDYELQERREALVQRYLDTLRELATVSPGAVWESFQEQHHRRALELVPILAKDHLPDLATSDPKDPRHVTDAQVEEHYHRNAADYDEPRRVDLEVVGVTLDHLERWTLEQRAPGQDDLSAWFEARRGDFVAATSTETYALACEKAPDLEDRVRTAVLADRARARADEVMQEVADRIEAVEAAKGELDLAAIAKAAAEATGNDVRHERTGEATVEEDLEKHPLLGGALAATRWFRVGEEGKTSDVLAGPKAWFVVRPRKVVFATSPRFEEVAARARTDYVDGSRKERRRFYDEHKHTRYLSEQAWKLEVLWAPAERFAEEGDGEGEAAQAKASERARGALQTLLDFGREKGWEHGFDLNRLYTDVPPERLSRPGRVDTLRLDAMTRAAIEQDERLGPALAGVVSTLDLLVLHGPVERADGKGWLLARVVSRKDREPRPFDGEGGVEDQVKEDVRLARGLERARARADELRAELRAYRGEELAAALKARGLEAVRTEAVARDAVTLAALPDAGRVVAAAFSSDAVVGGGFFRVEDDRDRDRVLLVRVAAKEDAPAADFEARYATLRIDILRKARGDYAEAQTKRLFLEAKGISPAHLEYATKHRDGPGGETRVRFRQAFFPPDRAIIERWLDEQARARVEEARVALAGSTFEAVIDRFSEDDATRVQKGELPPLQRGDLLAEYGADFEEAIFALPTDRAAVSAPIKSTRGYHLVRRLETREGRTTFQHLLVRTDPVARQLPQSVRDEADAAARKRAEDALARLGQGASFAAVADELGDARDPYGRGQELTIDYVTPFERAALVQPLEWEAPEGSPEANDPAWVPPAVEVPGLDGKSMWHLFACGRDPFDRAPAWETSTTLRDRQVFHIAVGSADEAERLRKAIATWLKDKAKEEDGRPGWSLILDHVKEQAAKRSKAPDGKKGGAFGLVQLQGDVRAYGAEFLDAVCRKPDGAPVTPGHRTGVVRGPAGYHVVEVLDVISGDERREVDVAELLLRGTTWR